MRSDSARAQAAEATRQLIIDSARRLFVAHGYHAVSIEQIVVEARVTRGALYHHFEDKRALFRVVFKAVEAELSARPIPEASLADQPDPWARYRLRVQTFLDAILKAEFHRVLLVDGPLVLGWEEWRKLETVYGLGAISPVLENAMAAGSIARQPVTPLAHIVLAALIETALLIANAADQDVTRREAGYALDSFLAGLSTAPATRPVMTGA